MSSNNKDQFREDSQDFSYVPCDFCKSKKARTLFSSKDYIFNIISGEFKIVKCSNCNLVYLNPRLKPGELNKYYSNVVNYGVPYNILDLNKKANTSFSLKFLTNFFNYPFGKKSKILKIIQYPFYLRIRKRYKKTQFLPTYIEDGKILEIGCSYGNYLFKLKKIGWNVKGLELNKESVDYSKRELNLDVVNQDINNFQPNELFDIIYLRMVLEHMESPKTILRKCYSWLKPNGKLVLIIPDFSGIEVNIYKNYAYTLHPPYHLYHFTPDTIKNLLKALNFKKIKIVHDNFDRDLIAPLNYILREHPNNLIANFALKITTKKIIRRTFVKIIVNILSLLGKTSRMTVIAEK